ncbi:MAG TPA: undecaprenyl-diphosphate phosphatase [Patescibacteria group bacterium]|jgi:undecaprenyl-diphosphatase|nr:undecaprenyl-diphosphate phosphatase [Patescibacteria group bacterium]
MNWIDAIVLGVVEGVTEFLPISSTGHLTIVEKLLGYRIDEPAITAFTAIIQIGAILAAVLYFRSDIVRVLSAWFAGLIRPTERKNHDYLYGWAIIIGSIPIAIVGLLFQHTIETTLRSLWWVAAGLIMWSLVLLYADKKGTQQRDEKSVTWRDTLLIGAVQCAALIPGVSRSGATISAGLLSGFDRVSATRLSFFLGIPALVAAGALQSVKEFDNISAHGVGWGPTLLATAISFIVGYVSISWLLKFVSTNNFRAFVYYRVILGAVIIALLLSGTITAV